MIKEAIAAIIVEPIAGNMAVIPPPDGFLEGLRALCSDLEVVLIFDEVITGFRVHPGGAQSLYGVEPDMTTLGKIIGGGLPVGAFGGKREIMSNISPLGKGVSQAGTLSGNPLAMTAGYETLTRLNDPGVYQTLESKAAALEAGFQENLKTLGLNYQMNRVGAMMTLFFSDQSVGNFEAATGCDHDLFARYFRAMLEQGIYLAPSQFEGAFVSLAHSDEDIQLTIKANFEALKSC